MPKLVSILEFAYRIGFTNLYDWQARILLRYEGGEPTAAACANGQAAKRSEIYTNLAAEWWSTVGQLIERRAIIIPNDEKLVAQLTSRRKQYDSKGREKLESKADLRARGVESPDRADALIGAIILGQESQIDWKAALAFQKEIKHRMHLDYLRTGRGRPHIDWCVV